MTRLLISSMLCIFCNALNAQIPDLSKLKAQTESVDLKSIPAKIPKSCTQVFTTCCKEVIPPVKDIPSLKKCIKEKKCPVDPACKKELKL